MAIAQSRQRARPEPMSRVDTAWLRMERPTNPMMITGVLMFAEPMALDRLRRVIKQRFLAYTRFWQMAVDTPAGASWQADENFDLDWHVQHAALPGRGGKRALQRFVSQLASSPLNHSRPLWQFHLVEHYEGGSALVARIHHSYADGIALVQVLLSLTDTTREPAKGSELSRTWLKKDHAAVARRVGAVDKYLKLGSKVLDKGREMVRDPTLAAVLAKEGGVIARELINMLALSDDPPSLLRGKLGVSKRVAWAEPLDLEEVKAVGRACNCTVNDVLMATAAGALRDYMIERGDHGRWRDPARDSAGQSAATGARQEAGQSFRPRVPRPARRRGQPDPPGGTHRRVHEQPQEFTPGYCCIWSFGGTWNGSVCGARLRV